MNQNRDDDQNHQINQLILLNQTSINALIYQQNTNFTSNYKNIMKGKKIPQIIDLLQSDQEKNEHQPNITQPVFKYQGYNSYPQKNLDDKKGQSKFNYNQLNMKLLESVDNINQDNANSLKDNTLLNSWKKVYDNFKQKSSKKKKVSDSGFPNSGQTVATNTNIHQSKPVQASYRQMKKTAPKHIQIYQFLKNNNIIPQKSSKGHNKCKICNNFINEDTINYCFQCQKCEKYCHFQCMPDTSTCPRCFYNWRMSKFKQPSQQFNLTNKFNEQLKNQTEKYSQKIQCFDLRSNSDKDLQQKQRNNANILQINSISPEFKLQLNNFVQKYPKYLNKRGNIILPIEDSLIYSTKFIRKLLQHKQIQLKQLPKIEDLPQYFGQVLQLWNFYRTFQCLIKNKQICRYPLQTFEEQLKNNQIHTFIIPIIIIILSNSGTSSNKMPAILRLFQDIKNQNMFQYFGRYFWTYTILQLIKNSKYKQQQISIKMTERISLMFDKRIYLVSSFQQKLQIIRFVIGMAEKSANFKSWISDSIKSHGQKISSVTQIMSQQRQKIRNKQKQTVMTYNSIQQKITTIKNNLVEHPMVVSKTLPSVSSVTINQIKKLQAQKTENIQLQQQLKQQIKELRQDIKSLQFVNEMEYSNKVTYLGKDRNKSLYWFVFGAEASDVVFKSTLPQVQNTYQLNQFDQQKKQPQSKNNRVGKQKWGFYHGIAIEELVSCLNSSGIQERRLKKNIQNLFSLNLLATKSSKKLSRAKQFYNQLNSKKQQKQSLQQQIQNCKQFLDNNIKQINLSQLRKLLLETLKIFNNFVRKSVGIWRVNKEYQQKIKNQKFKNLEDIKNFVFQFGRNLYSLKNDLNSKNNKGRQKRGCQLWLNRIQMFTIWKSRLQSCTKNTQVFMYGIILYLQVVNTARKVQNPDKYNNRANIKSNTYKNTKSSSSSKSSSRQKSSSQIQSWSGSHDNLMQVDSLN